MKYIFIIIYPIDFGQLWCFLNMKTKIEIYDPPMCCSVDPEHIRFAADVLWLKQNGIEVERYELSHQVEAFMRSPVVSMALFQDEHCLPLILVDNNIVSKGTYVSREVLAKFVGIKEGSDHD